MDEKKLSGRELLFTTHGIPPMGASLSLAFQHLVAMIVGCVTPAIIVANAAGLEMSDRVILIQASLVGSSRPKKKRRLEGSSTQRRPPTSSRFSCSHAMRSTA